MDLHLVNDLMWKFGLPAIFLLTMEEGDITLLLAGVLAHGQGCGDYSELPDVGARTLWRGLRLPQRNLHAGRQHTRPQLRSSGRRRRRPRHRHRGLLPRREVLALAED